MKMGEAFVRSAILDSLNKAIEKIQIVDSHLYPLNEHADTWRLTRDALLILCDLKNGVREGRSEEDEE